MLGLLHSAECWVWLGASFLIFFGFSLPGVLFLGFPLVQLLRREGPAPLPPIGRAADRLRDRGYCTSTILPRIPQLWVN